MQLAWQSNNEKGTDIKEAMEGLTEVSFVEAVAYMLCSLHV